MADVSTLSAPEDSGQSRASPCCSACHEPVKEHPGPHGKGKCMVPFFKALMRDRFDTLQQRVSDLEEQPRESEKRQAKELCDMQALHQERLDRLEEQLRESEKRQAKELCDIQALHQERLDGLMSLIETLQKDEKVCAGVSRNADPSVSAHKDEEGKKSAKIRVDDHHAGVSGMRSASDNVSGSTEPVPDLELSADVDAGKKKESSSPKTYAAITMNTANDELGSSKTSGDVGGQQGQTIGETATATPNEWRTQTDRRQKRKAGKPAKRESSLARVPLGKLCGAQKITRSVFYVGGMNPQCTAEDLRSFCSEFLEVIDCRVMPSSRYGTVAARLVVRSEDAHKAESINWPDHVFARPWKFSPTNNRTPSDRQHDPNEERTLTESLASGQ